MLMVYKSIFIAETYTTVQKFGFGFDNIYLCFFKEVSCSPRLHVFDQNTANIITV